MLSVYILLHRDPANRIIKVQLQESKGFLSEVSRLLKDIILFR